MRLSFEITLAVAAPDFAADVEQMFLKDLSAAELLTRSDIEKRPIYRRIGWNIARLFSPVL